MWLIGACFSLVGSSSILEWLCKSCLAWSRSGRSTQGCVLCLVGLLKPGPACTVLRSVFSWNGEDVRDGVGSKL